MNRAFDLSHRKDGRELLPTDEKTRLLKPEQIAEEIDPDGFTILLFQNQNHEDGETEILIGTASAKPYTPTKSSSESGDPAYLLFKRPAPPSSEAPTDTTAFPIPKYEILAMAVDPSLQGQGLASRMLGLVVEEIKSRAVDEWSEKGLRGEKRVQILLSTMQEVNETYYAKRGWRWLGDFRRGRREARTALGLWRW